MNIKSEFITKLEESTGELVRDARSVSGGCIANSKIITTQSGKKFFVKTHSGTSRMFINEANGLLELKKAACIRVPGVVVAEDDFLVLECIDEGTKPASFFECFGEAFAQMHRTTSDAFGFFEDNYIGSSPQYNIASRGAASDWANFYFEKRLLPQLKMAENNGVATAELSRGMAQLESQLGNILQGSEEPPALLHGDLWGGNYLCDTTGNPVLIDPAVYYGHREADLAMTRMFGGFSAGFYLAYQKTYPLCEGWQRRQNIYMLYHSLNHLNLFGSSYYGQCLSNIGVYL